MTATARSTKAPDAATQALHRSYLRQMMLIRRFEEKAGEAYSLGKIGGFCHLYIGQEAVAVGVMAALRPDDHVISAYREHGHALARGLTSRAVMAELFGKATGSSAGKGGSMHIFDAAAGFLGGHGIVGSHIPLAAGVAFAHKYRGGDQLCVCFFGEAAANIGAFHETLNMASLWDLPAIFIVENNGYGMGTAVSRAAAVTNLSVRGNAYDMPAEQVDGQNVLTVREAMDRAVTRARAESKPTLLEIKTYRYVGHSMSDAAHGTYRTKDEVDEYRRRDPIAVLADLMKAGGYWDDGRHDALVTEVQAEVEDAVTFADASPDPDPSALYTDVYAPEGR
ncbi:MAG: pyruvate dehydrogenase (acetyl-transferring) E1 component subunit alpha [Gemmatimonadetes bacterium]|nr:pyruvate dehydrogenase (acetyl-transferring) E1 component subunit alpha [Gemmatimonadota bacterium]MCC7132019.1 pyruvate dehydrogenase (acetyl-transferring) E1 component subunit alpha [Gemmatimonadales bacterium]